MRRRAATIAALAGTALWLAGCVTTGSGMGADDSRTMLARHATKSGWQLPAQPADAAAEPAQAGLMRQRIEGLGVAPLPSGEAYLNQVLGRVVAAWPHARPAMRAYLFPSEQFAAYSTADGGVFVSLAMLRSLESEDELAAVLAHEAAHILLGHHTAGHLQIIQNVAANVFEIGLTVKLGRQQTVTELDLVRSALMSEAAREVGQTGLFPAWTRDQEEQADLLGADLMRAVPYSPTGMLTFLDRNIEWERRVDASRELADKQKHLSFAGKNMPTAARPGSDPLAAGLAELMKAGEGLFSQLRRDHPDPVKRRQVVDAYLERHDMLSGAPDEQPTPYRTLLQQPDVAGTLKEFRELAEARELLLRQKPGEAVALLAPPPPAPVPAGATIPARDRPRTAAQRRNAAAAAQATPPAAPAAPRVETPYALLVRADVLFAAGRGGEAETMVDAAMTAPDSILDAYRRKASWLSQRGQPRESLAVLSQAVVVFGNPPTLLPDLIVAANRAGQKEQADILAMQCAVVGTPGIKDACRKAQGLR